MAKKLNIDLHTHSIASPDGSITLEQYADLLAVGRVDYVAVTDHDRIDFALDAYAQLGKQIIVGEEITTADGEIIGLFLTRRVAPGKSALETAQAIKRQGGLVYVPHPFETLRKGLSIESLDEIAEFVDIIEAPNGRSLQPKDAQALDWAERHAVAIAGSSDAHRADAVGKTHTAVAKTPSAKNLALQLQKATITFRRASLLDILAPKYNRYVKRKKWVKA